LSTITNSTFVSLDGVINHMERWHFDYIDEESNAVALEQLRAADALLMGRHTYDIYASAWPGRDGEIAERINAMTKYVASTTLETADWQNTTVMRGDLVEGVSALKGGPERILMHGYGPVAKTLVRHGLLDELILWIHPVLAGVGTATDVIFTDGLHRQLTLHNTKPLDSGVVVLSYWIDRDR
jgi:dihydrofolate reductase